MHDAETWTLKKGGEKEIGINGIRKVKNKEVLRRLVKFWER